MNAMASRTLLVDPKQEQKEAYMVAHDAQELLIAKLQVGSTIASAYDAAKNLIAERNSNLTVHNNFGFGIGFNFKEDRLGISASNETVVEEGMSFHVRVAITGVHKEPARSVVAIGDTIIVSENGNKVLTKGIQKKYAEISYSLEESEPIEEKKPSKTDKTPAKNGAPKKQDSARQKTKGASSEDAFDDESSEDEENEAASAGSMEVMAAGSKNLITSSRLRSKAQN